MKLLNPLTAGANGETIYDIQFNNCGSYADAPVSINVVRKNGREDYHLIFVEKGEVSFKKGKTERTAKSGDVIFIPPYTPQIYSYKEGQGTLYWWLHFSGIKVEDLLKVFPFEHNAYSLKYIGNYTKILSDLLKSHVYGKAGNEFYLNSETQSLLTKLGQEIFYRHNRSRNAHRIMELAAKIRSEPKDNFKTDELAEEFGISEFHFIRLFKEETGYSPHKYRTLMLMEQSKNLLIDTNLNINEISYMLNFSDPLYFSRIFKKYIGVSPKEYRSSGS